MDKFRFLNWEAYNDSKKLFSHVLKIVRKLPKEFRFELGSQIIRCAFSAMDVLKDNKFIENKEFDDIYKMVVSISNQLGGFKKKLSR